MGTKGQLFESSFTCKYVADWMCFIPRVKKLHLLEDFKMDITGDVFEPELYESLVSAGVRKVVLEKLQEDELNTAEILESTSDELLKACGLKGGQIVLLQKGLKAYKDRTKNMSHSLSPPSTPLHCSSPSTSFEASDSLSPPRSSTTVSDNPSTTIIEKKTPSVSPKAAFESAPEPDTQRSKMNWITNFKLPSMFSADVTSELRKKVLSPNRRNEFTRDICSAIRVHTLNPSKTEREHVALAITRTYPFLADKLGTGIGSWQEAIKNRFKNLRKSKRPATKSIATGEKAATLCKKSKRSASDIPTMHEGETQETCEEHIKTIKKEMSKPTNRDIGLVKELMEITFPYRRQGVVLDPVIVKTLLLKYPALQLVSELKNEFGRAVGDKHIVRTMADQFRSIWQAKILKLAIKRKLEKALFSEAQDAIEADPEEKPVIEEALAVMVLPSLIKDRGSKDPSLIKICSDDESIDKEIEQSSTPRLVGSGEVGEINPLYLVTEGVVVAKLNNIGLASALALLVGCFYIFNMEYPKSSRNFFFFLEAALMDNSGEARKRVSINKLFQDLN